MRQLILTCALALSPAVALGAQRQQAVKRVARPVWVATDSVAAFMRDVSSAYLSCRLSGARGVAKANLMVVQKEPARSVVDTAYAAITCRDSLRTAVQARFSAVRDSVKAEGLRSAFKEFFATTLSAIDALSPATDELSGESSAIARYSGRVEQQADLINKAANRAKSEM